MSKLLTDPVERIRQAALIVLGRLNNAETQQTLLTFLTDPSQEIRDSAVIALSRMGKSAVLLLQPSLESDNALMRRMATVALCKIDRERSVDLIRSYILNNLTAIYGNHVRLNALIDCSGYRSMGILVSTLRERNADMIAEIFYLLSALHDPKTIRVIADSLDTDDSRKRANALEAIEERSTPQIARLIAPLFDRELPTDQLIKIARENSGIGGNSKEIMTAIATDANDSWLRAVMLVALAEISASVFEIAMSKAESLESSEEERKPQSSDIRDSETREGGGKIRGKTGRSSLDLLGTLTGDSKLARSEPPPDQPTRKGSRPKTGDISTVPDSKAIASVPSTSALSPCQSLFSKFEVDALLKRAENNPQEVVRLAVVSATRMVAGQSVTEIFQSQGGIMLSAIEKIIFLKEVSFFEGMTIDQLKILASVAEEEVFNEDQVIFNEGELGGALYVVVRGRVALERDSGGARKGSMLRIGTVQAYSYFGEMTLFDNSPRSERAIATQDTLVLRLRREPLIALTRQYPELSLKLINVLSARLREANDRIAQLTTAKPRELHKVFDKLG
jgi:CRP-like cAMP-binding protein